MKSTVAIVKCTDYDENRVYESLKKGIGILGGIEKFVPKDESILIKPNFLTLENADKAVTTHPAVIRGLLKLLNETGYKKVAFGDSPATGSGVAVAGHLGIGPDDELFGATPAPMNEEVLYSYPDGKYAKEFYFTKEIAESENIINLCKMKTHALECITGAVKNVYGYICGHRKALGHVKYPSSVRFADMLCDIHKCKGPKLNIMDGIVAMEGNGPGSGTPTPMNVLLFSTDPVALDTVYAHLVNVDTGLIPTCFRGEKNGIGTCTKDNITIVIPNDENTLDNSCNYKEISFEEAFELFGNAAFDVDRNGKRKSLLSRVSDFMTKKAKKPVIDENLCVRCGVCVSNCPVPGKAIDFVNGRESAPQYDYSKCIRCYCCQEICPKHAISVLGQKKKGGE